MKKYSVLTVLSLVLLIGAFFIGTQVGKSDSGESKATATTKPTMKTTPETKMEVKDEVKEDADTGTMKTSAPMGEEPLKLDASLPTPSISIQVVKDAMKGYNLSVSTKNFRFRPEQVNTPEGKTPQNIGHAHIYVNGVKLTRLYSNNFYIGADAAKPGDKITVSLNSNKHRNIILSEEVVL